jgi:hypothetical protein
MILPTTKTSRTYDYRKLSGIVYGRPKVGKSTFCASLDSGKVLFLDTEDGTKHLDVYKVEIKTWNDVLQASHDLLTTDHGFSLVVLDTVSALKEKCIEYVLDRMRAPDVYSPKFSAHGRGWTMVNSELQKLWTRLLAGNFGCYFVDHETSVETRPDGTIIRGEDTYNGPRLLRVQPQLSGKPGQSLKGLCDLILRASIAEDGTRILETMNTAQVEAGDRSGVLPGVMPLDPAAFVECFRNAHKIATSSERSTPQD